MPKNKLVQKKQEIIKNKEVFNQIFESERNIKKGKIKELKY